ncbi:MAG TPA: NHL repeat-containing protein [Phycisphaerae bacterium]|nr:NHL repeat-containing protein [Phycisphaerae bacterium]
MTAVLGLGFAVVIAAVARAQPALELWVSSSPAVRVDPYSGSTLGYLFPQSPDAVGFAFGLDGNVYVADSNTDRVLRYNPQGDELIDVFVPAGSGGIDGPMGVVFGPDGNLYVAGSWSNNIVRYDGSTGAFIDVFATTGLDGPHSLRFGPDGNLYVTSDTNDRLLRFNGQTGQLMDILAEGGELDGPLDLIFGPDDLLYVGNRWTGSVARYDPLTGESLGYFVQPHAGDLHWAFGLAFGPHDGNLYVADQLRFRVRRYDGQTGAYLGVLAALDNPTFLAFVPEPGSLLLLAAGVVLLGRKRRA